jgi:magnesium transporter
MSAKESSISNYASLLIPSSREKSDSPRITVIDYDATHYQEIEVKGIEECFVFKETPQVTWINIDGLRQVDMLEKLGACYGFHPLILEDILSDQRAKVEDYDDYIFIVLKMLFYKKENDEESIDADQISMILGPNFVVSFKEKEVDIFKSLRDRLRTGKGRIRKQGSDYLAYSIMDAVVDHYFVILEKLGERFEELEDQIVESPEPSSLTTIYNLKRDMLFLRN